LNDLEWKTRIKQLIWVQLLKGQRQQNLGRQKTSKIRRDFWQLSTL